MLTDLIILNAMDPLLKRPISVYLMYKKEIKYFFVRRYGVELEKAPVGPCAVKARLSWVDNIAVCDG